tara:strand:- start:1267 stop:1395 length:129 start_codon:yes stop_codon:yes gene_type:complete
MSKVIPKTKKDEYELPDSEFLLIEALQDLAKEIKKLRMANGR